MNHRPVSKPLASASAHPLVLWRPVGEPVGSTGGFRGAPLSHRHFAVALAVVIAAGCSEDSASVGGPNPALGCLNAANPVRIGGVFTLTFGASADVERVAAPQMQVFASEVNTDCGLFRDADGRGRAVEPLVRDGQDLPSVVRSLMPELLDDEEVAFMVGAGGSDPTIPAADRAFDRQVPFGINFAISDSLSGCTVAQLDDPAVMKSSSPVYDKEGLSCWRHNGLVLRTSGASTQLGQTAARWMADPRSGLSDLRQAATIVRFDGFGIPAGDGFALEFAESGGQVLDEVLFTPNSETEIFKDKIRELVANDPEIIVGVWRLGELRAFMQAWVELDDDPTFTKPSRWDSVRFIHLGTLQDNYSDTGPDVVDILNERTFGISQDRDPESPGYSRWLDVNRNFNPDFVPSAHTEPKTYDLLMLWTLAMVKANATDGPLVAAAVNEIANPPGTVFYPGQFAEAREAILAGDDIDYECAFGTCDFNEATRLPMRVPYLVWRVTESGTPDAVTTLIWQPETN